MSDERGMNVATVFGDLSQCTRLREVHCFGWNDDFAEFIDAHKPEVVTVWGTGGPEGANHVSSQDEFRGALRGHLLAWAAGAALVNQSDAESRPDDLAGFWVEVDEAEARRAINRNTARSRARDFTRSVIENLLGSRSSVLATELGRPISGFPAFIVSAGPSLSKNVHLVEEASRRGPVFVVNTAAKALDCDFDVLVTIENKDVSSHWADADGRAEFICPSMQSNASSFRTSMITLPFFTAGSPMGKAAEKVGAQVLPSGPSVATAAVCIAQAWGADAVVLLGQDCAYTNGQTHADGTHYDGQEAPKTSLMLPSWGGDGEVCSRADLVMFARWFEEHARRCESHGIDTQMVNCTEGGARLSGWTERTLAEELSRWPTDWSSEVLADAWASSKPLGLSRVRAFHDAVLLEAQGILDECASQIASGELNPLTPGGEFVDAWATPAVIAAFTSGASLSKRGWDATWAWLTAATEVQTLLAGSFKETGNDD